MKKLKMWLISVKIEWHWWFIIRIRRKGNSLLRGGAALTSQKLYHLNRRLSSHSTKAMKAQAAYNILAKK
ncbi:MAG: hypothetical protein GX488_04020 [Clostridiales bacterium]|nr:hypothetical protein [Clostridiales bacterium]